MSQRVNVVEVTLQHPLRSSLRYCRLWAMKFDEIVIFGTIAVLIFNSFPKSKFFSGYLNFNTVSGEESGDLPTSVRKTRVVIAHFTSEVRIMIFAQGSSISITFLGYVVEYFTPCEILLCQWMKSHATVDKFASL